MPKIHPLACVDPAAQIADDVSIGPFCVIGPQIQIGSGCLLHNSVTFAGDVIVGANNEFFANVVIGTPPQDLSHNNGVTKVRIADNNVFRAGVTVNGGSDKFRNETRIGSNGMFMINVHIGHDSYVGDNCLVVNGSNIGGHNHLEDNARISGVIGSHPFVTFGSYCYVGGVSAITRDVPPFTAVTGAYPAKVRCINEVGLRRGGFSEESITALKRAFFRLFRSGLPKQQLIDEFEVENAHDENVTHLVRSLRRSARHQHNRFLEAVYQGQIEPDDQAWEGCKHPWARSLLGAQTAWKFNSQGART